MTNKQYKCLRCGKNIDSKKEIVWAISADNWFHYDTNPEDYKVYLCGKCHSRAIKRTLKRRIIILKTIFYEKLIYFCYTYIFR